MEYLIILGRQPEISLAELETQFPSLNFLTDSKISPKYCRVVFPETPSLDSPININKFGGIQKLAIKLSQKPLEYLSNLPEGKITLGISDYSKKASRKTANLESLKLKKILVRHGRSVRVVENKEAVLSTATSFHNGLSGKNERKIELIKVEDKWYKVIGIQDITAYVKRDQARPARDAKVGMLPPKLAQILINLCGPLKQSSIVLDPFCGTGVVLQEALLIGYRAYGTDINDKMVEYSIKNLEWLTQKTFSQQKSTFQVHKGDATSYTWQQPIDAIACEGYLGKPFSKIPNEIDLKEQKQKCQSIILGFLKNLAKQIKTGTPVVIAVPAWLRQDGSYERLDIFDRSRSSSEEKRSFSSKTTQDEQLFPTVKVDEIKNMGYNVNNKSREGLLYHREGQVVARDIIILRKK